MIALRLFGAFLCLAVVAPVLAEAPQPVIIQTQVLFSDDPVVAFTATAPLCESGTGRELSRVSNRSPAHGWKIVTEYTCDDDSGTFILQYHPQAGSEYAGGTREPVFTVSGPWSVVNGGTGQYTKLTGHGDFGVVIDFSVNPWTGEESFVGFVQLQ